MGPRTQLAISLGKTAAQIVAEFSPIPGLYPAVDLLCGIMDRCENVTHNRNTARHLRDRCHLLVLALRDNHQRLANGKADDARTHGKLADAIDCLLDIQTRMDGWVHIGILQGFTKQRDIETEIEQCLTAITDCLMKFQLVSQMEIHEWQKDFTISVKHDHTDLMEFLSEMKDSQAITSDLLDAKMDANLEMTRKLMKMMQGFMAENKQTAERMHNGISNNLWQLQRRTGELMPDLHLKAGEVKQIGEQPIKWTNVVDIYEGLYLRNEKVYIKILRAVDANEHSLRRFNREVKIWAEVWKLDRGKHILPFYGFVQDDGSFPYMVSPWQKNGTALEYVKLHDTTIDYVRLIRGIALGIEVLHCSMKPPIVHGVIRAENIYIDNEGNPLIADFGLSQIVEDITGTPFTQSHGILQSYRWFAPEICVGEGSLSLSSDIYAYAMTVLEIMTHQQPYSHIKRTTEVVIKSSQGEYPKRPTGHRVTERGLDDKLWHLLNKCWSPSRTARPSIKDVLLQLV